MADERDMNCNDTLLQNLEEACKLKQFQRLNFFNGMLMTASDFELWQRNIEEKRHLINRLVLGSGVVCGLEVLKIEKKSEECYCDPSGVPTMVTDRWLVTLSAGVAIDCMGREIVVSNKEGHYFVVEKTPVEELTTNRGYFGLYIRRKDKLKHPVPTAANASCSDEMCCYSHIEENFELVFDKLIQTPRLAFDRLSYRPDDNVNIQATIYLFEPLSDGSGERKVKIRTAIENPDVSLTKMVEESAALKVDVFKADLLIGARGSKEITAEYESTSGTYTRRAYIRDGSKFNNKFEKRRIGDEYYRVWLDECSCCDDVGDPKMLLAILGPTDNPEGETSIEVKDIPGVWHRDIVYNNKMLYDLISCHLVDLENPPVPKPHIKSGTYVINDTNFGDGASSAIQNKGVIIVSNEIKHESPKIPAIILGLGDTLSGVEVEERIGYMGDGFFPNEVMSQITRGAGNTLNHNFLNDIGTPDLFAKAIEINSQTFRILLINYDGDEGLPLIYWWALSD